MAILVSITHPSPQILGKSQTGVLPISGISGQFLIKENCHTFRTSDDIDMKLGPVTKLDQKNKKPSKKSDVDVMLLRLESTLLLRLVVT